MSVCTCLLFIKDYVLLILLRDVPQQSKGNAILASTNNIWSRTLKYQAIAVNVDCVLQTFVLRLILSCFILLPRKEIHFVPPAIFHEAPHFTSEFRSFHFFSRTQFEVFQFTISQPTFLFLSKYWILLDIKAQKSFTK